MGDTGGADARAETFARLKQMRRNGERPSGVAIGGWLGDFLDQKTESGLLPGERRLLDSVESGGTCDLLLDNTLPDDVMAAMYAAAGATTDPLADPAPQTETRQYLRGAFIRFLALGGDENVGVHEHGVEIRGAIVIGTFDLHRAKQVAALSFRSCAFGAELSFMDATLESLWMQNTRVPRILAEGAEIREDVFLRDGFHAERGVFFRGADIEGGLDCRGGLFTRHADAGRNDLALDFTSVKISGDALLSEGFKATGRVSFKIAKIGGQLDCCAGHFENSLDNSTAIALDCERTEISSSVILARRGGNHFRAEGAVIFRSAKIGSSFDCSCAAFSNKSKRGKTTAIDCKNIEIAGDVEFRSRCSVSGGISFNGAKIGGVFDCESAHFDNQTDDGRGVALDLTGVQISRDAYLNRKLTVFGRVLLFKAKIGGQLSCADAAFENSSASDSVLSCQNAEIAGDVLLHDNFSAKGRVSFRSAKIGDTFDCRNGRFLNPSDDGSGAALDCDGASFSNDVLLQQGFVSEGRVSFRNAKIDGDLALDGGDFKNLVQPGDQENSEAQAADAVRIGNATINGVLRFGRRLRSGQSAKILGSVDLRGAHARLFVDDPDGWPGGAKSPYVVNEKGERLRCTISLDGFTFDRFASPGAYDAQTRRRWLERQPPTPKSSEFRPQPYVQTVKALREIGQDSDARVIDRSRRRRHRNASFRRMLRPSWEAIRANPLVILLIPIAPVFWLLEFLLLDLFASYGYGKQRLLVLLLLVWAAGAEVYRQASKQGLIVPTSTFLYRDDDDFSACRDRWTLCADMPDEYTFFNAALYSADIVAPVVAFGMESDWEPMHVRAGDVDRPEGSAMTLSFASFEFDMGASFLRLFFVFQIIAGWIISGLLVTSVTGMMKTE